MVRSENHLSAFRHHRRGANRFFRDPAFSGPGSLCIKTMHRKEFARRHAAAQMRRQTTNVNDGGCSYLFVVEN
jgi:hypothetical protein